jgi:peptide/nickel transport system substrate-binding protein
MRERRWMSGEAPTKPSTGAAGGTGGSSEPAGSGAAHAGGAAQWGGGAKAGRGGAAPGGGRPRRPRRGWRTALGAALAAAVLAAAAACGGSAPGTGNAAPKDGGRVTVAITQEPDSLDPQRSSLATSSLLFGYAGDTLVTQDPSGKIVPDLATSWKVSPDGLHYTFQLKQGVTFQNGDQFDAAAAKASFDRALDPATKAAAVASYLAPVTAIKATAPYELTFDLKQPFAYFLDGLAASQTVIVNARAAASMGNEFSRTPILTGPFQITRWDAGSQVVMKRNDKYRWGPSFLPQRPPHLAGLTFRIIPDNGTRVSAVQNGEAQWTYNLPSAKIATFQNNDQFRLIHAPRKGLGLYLGFDVHKAPFDDPDVRKAIATAVDKQAIVKVALQGRGQPACGPLASTIPGAWSGACNATPKHDTSQAQKLLAQAGWKKGADGKLAKNGTPFAFTLYTSDAAYSGWSDAAQLLQQQLKPLGIDMQVQNFEYTTLLSKCAAGEPAAFFGAYTFTNANILTILFHSRNNRPGGLNFTKFADPATDQALNTADTAADPAQRDKAVQQVQKTLIDQTVTVPIWTDDIYGVINTKVQNVKLDSLGNVMLQAASLSG